jgi:hypothetical protein
MARPRQCYSSEESFHTSGGGRESVLGDSKVTFQSHSEETSVAVDDGALKNEEIAEGGSGSRQ